MSYSKNNSARDNIEFANADAHRVNTQSEIAAALKVEKVSEAVQRLALGGGNQPRAPHDQEHPQQSSVSSDGANSVYERDEIDLEEPWDERRKIDEVDDDEQHVSTFWANDLLQTREQVEETKEIADEDEDQGAAGLRRGVLERMHRHLRFYMESRHGSNKKAFFLQQLQVLVERDHSVEAPFRGLWIVPSMHGVEKLLQLTRLHAPALTVSVFGAEIPEPVIIKLSRRQRRRRNAKLAQSDAPEAVHGSDKVASGDSEPQLPVTSMLSPHRLEIVLSSRFERWFSESFPTHHLTEEAREAARAVQPAKMTQEIDMRPVQSLPYPHQRFSCVVYDQISDIIQSGFMRRLNCHRPEHRMQRACCAPQTRVWTMDGLADNHNNVIHFLQDLLPTNDLAPLSAEEEQRRFPHTFWNLTGAREELALAPIHNLVRWKTRMLLHLQRAERQQLPILFIKSSNTSKTADIMPAGSYPSRWLIEWDVHHQVMWNVLPLNARFSSICIYMDRDRKSQHAQGDEAFLEDVKWKHDIVGKLERAQSWVVAADGQASDFVIPVFYPKLKK